MALVVTSTSREVMNFGNKKMVRGITLALDSSQPATGYPLTASDFGLNVIEELWVIGGGGGYVYEFDAADQELLVYGHTTNNPTIETDVSAITAVRVLAIGY